MKVVGPLMLVAAANLTSCLEKRLEQCLTSTEQTILLRQLNLTKDERERFDFCARNESITACRARFLNAETVVRQCMKGHGYPHISDGRCSYSDCSRPACYVQTWVDNLIIDARNKKNSN